MSIEYMSLQLEGPLQSWGVNSEYSRRNTELMPTKSGICGMCCAGAGANRGSDLEKQIISEFYKIRMLSIAIPKKIGNRTLKISRMRDYHTVQNTITAEGKIKECHLTERFYLTDAKFGVVLSGDSDVLYRFGKYLSNPVWGLWLGRKNCIPSVPIFIGIFENKIKALEPLIGNVPLDNFTRQEDVLNFSDEQGNIGTAVDSISDNPVSFNSSNRKFAPRRVRTIYRIKPK